MVEKLLIALLGVLAVGALLVIGSLSGAVFGSISGWIMGWVFDETMQKLLVDVLYLQNIEPWEFGAMLGFVGGFIRSSCASSSS